MPDQLRMRDAERIDRPDMEFLAAIPQAAGQQLGGNLLTNPAGVRAWIVSGFRPVNNGSNQVKVARGVAILATNNVGVVEYGALATEGDPERIIDVTGYGNGTYGVFVRFELTDGGFGNRIFWDPGLASERTENVPTRRVANWGMTIQLSSPGAEWLRVGDAVVAGGLLTSVVPKRNLYFEGHEDTTYTRDWGGGTDRNGDRSTYGLKDFQTFGQAVLKKLEEIQSNTARWWTATVEPLDKKVSRDGDLTLAGSYKISGSGETFTLGDPGNGVDLIAEGLATFSENVTMKKQLLPDTGVGPNDIGQSGSRWNAIYGKTLSLESDYGPTPAIAVSIRDTDSNAAQLVVGGMTDPTVARIGLNAAGPFVGSTDDFTVISGVGGIRFDTVSGNGLLGLASPGSWIPSPGASTLFGSAVAPWTAWLNGLDMQGHITASANDTWDIGTTGTRFRDAYFNVVDIDENLFVGFNATFGAGTAASGDQSRFNHAARFQSGFTVPGGEAFFSNTIRVDGGLRRGASGAGDEIEVFGTASGSQAVMKFYQTGGGGKFFGFHAGEATDQSKPLQYDGLASSDGALKIFITNGTFFYQKWIRFYDSP